MKAFGILPTTAAISIPLALHADDLPKRQSGLWEITESSPDESRGRKARVCIDKATEFLLDNIDMITRRGRCRESDATTTGNILMLETTCDFRSSRVDTRARIAIADPRAFRIEAQRPYSPPLFGKRESTRLQDGKWSGPCPNDMSPGDMIADGMSKRNLVDGIRPSETARSTRAE